MMNVLWCSMRIILNWTTDIQQCNIPLIELLTKYERFPIIPTSCLCGMQAERTGYQKASPNPVLHVALNWFFFNKESSCFHLLYSKSFVFFVCWGSLTLCSSGRTNVLCLESHESNCGGGTVEQLSAAEASSSSLSARRKAPATLS